MTTAGCSYSLSFRLTTGFVASVFVGIAVGVAFADGPVVKSLDQCRTSTTLILCALEPGDVELLVVRQSRHLLLQSI